MREDATAKRRAIIVGVNASQSPQALPTLKYAEEDARALRDVLTHPETGTFDPADVTLLVGVDANCQNIKRVLRRRARETSETDLLFVYYSGHGLIPSWSRGGEVYLATEDLRIEALEDEPDSGLRMSFLRQDVFDEIRGISLLILDCCFSGEYVSPRSMSVVNSTQREGSHAALLACSSGVSARERDDIRHGEFTHSLLEGLRGAAARFDGEVTLDSLYVWLKQSAGSKPLTDARNWGVHVALTRPRLRLKLPIIPGLPADASGLSQVEVARHHLDAHLPQLHSFLDRLLDSAPIGTNDSGATNARHRLDIVRAALGASAAGLAEVSDDGVRFLRWTDRSSLEASIRQVAELGVTSRERRRQSLATVGLDPEGRVLYCVPLLHSGKEKVQVLVAIHPEADVVAMGEPLAVLVKAFMRPEERWEETIEGLELGLLTSLRSTFGRLPYEVYDRAFTLYRREIQRLVVVFQKVVKLLNQGATGGTHSYEALARVAYSDRNAPGELLDTASIWGDRFIIERDLILAAKAIDAYSRLHLKQGSSHTAQPVSINVAVRSLLSPSYVEVVRESIRSTNLEGAVTLEISEQDPIILPDEIDSIPSPMEAFRRHLIGLMRDLEVGFAVDDFGVGHSSLDRLAMLSLTQIKIDRAVLEHPLALEELRLVVKIAQEALERGGAAARTVVLEGVDAKILASREGGQALTLKQIYDAGIRYIQGYITGDPLTIDLRDPAPDKGSDVGATREEVARWVP